MTPTPPADRSTTRSAAARTSETGPRVGDLLELSVGPVAHGGHCVARHEGRVVFVRHALPGERVRARLTAVARSSFWRADAVEVLEPSPDRVPSVWPSAGPGGVGGGELAHVSLVGQRRWKADVVREQLTRLARLDLDGLGLDVVVEPAAGDDARGGLGWRTRVDLVAGRDGRAGMHGYRSHDVVRLTEVPIASVGATALLAREGVFSRRWRPGTRIEAVAPASGGPGVLLVDGAPWRHGRPDERPNARRVVNETVRVPVLAGVAGVVVPEDGVPVLELRVAAGGFWQVHDRAPETLVDAVLRAAAPDGATGLAGAHVVDLYSGAGLLSVPLALAVGPTGSVTTVEGDARAVRDARRNTHDLGWVALHQGDVAETLDEVAGGADAPDVVVLDPPRTGAGARVVDQVAATGAPRVVYVACDPAALARDVATFVGHGYRLEALRAFDLFPMTHHVECVATLVRGPGPGAAR